jgi:flagellar assembly protein FliH
LSDTTSFGLLDFVPDVVGAHTTVFRVALPHGPAEEDTGAPSEMPDRLDPTLLSSQDQIRMEVEHELREQMQVQLDALQEDVDRRLREFAEHFERHRDESERQLREAAAELALAAARRLVCGEIERDPKIIARVVEEAVAEVATDTTVTLRVHPLDGEHLREQTEFLKRLRVTEVVDDPTLRAGGCVVESANRAWDASLDTRVAAVEERVQAALGSQ